MIIAQKKSQNWKRPKAKKISAYIKSVDSLGLMQIQFSRNMNTTKIMKKLNTTYVDIFVTPYSDRENLKERNVNLTWNITSFENKTLLVQMNF